ncbi:prepilin-type N-terminal cleavage/methylation domain-containing protein [Streptomyces sp. SID10815]|uniref:type IV pilin protein n=1 Tax=Streptomyces sp. SID10815 TaxID=2706027 RepID=UPI0013C8BACE|nr:prepilin-type N-terminal cleavage/methylation domain-containing protein [Streptomyces sp. SID10815]NEA51976.1 prepilin-type N-terminal cleavage/methylation domain-containing protein [Streptomyces sp. SID10815]
MFTHLQDTLHRRTRARSETAEAGFTLIELLVVIVILGVLAAIVVFSVRGINDKGQGSACKTDKSTIDTAEEAYFATNGKYGTMDQLKEGFLSDASNWYTVELSGSTYSVTLKKLENDQPNPCAS